MATEPQGLIQSVKTAASRSRFLVALAGVFAALLAALCLWQAPGSKLSAGEVERYLSVIDKTLPLAGEERARMLARMRAFAESDDGQPFYMLNLMRYYERVRELPGAPAFAGTPREANARYEDRAIPMLVEQGGYPSLAARASARDLFGHDAPLDDWSRVLVVRYPDRRAFFDLVTDPRYGPIAPYKLMAQDIVLVPMAAELAIPDVRIVAGGALVGLFLLIGWWRTARRRAPEAPRNAPCPPAGGGARDARGP
ncbi:MAG TPA: hypothetical protein VMN56_15430 [Casimicrobiaceae bacterium]|nr:hypothetical protein [Casimicrobiaceae bacterium]